MIISTDKSSSVGVINHSLAGRWNLTWSRSQYHQVVILTGLSSSDFFLNYGGDNGRILLINA